MKCGSCGRDEFEAGFLEDTGQAAQGHVRWIPGALERGLFGGAKRLGKQRWKVAAHRCTACGHLEFFATEPD